MLYRGKEPFTVADPFEVTLDDLVAWLETKPRDKAYHYVDNFSCLLCQFLESRGVAAPQVNNVCWSDGEQVHLLPRYFDFIASEGQWSYGAALARARACR